MPPLGSLLKGVAERHATTAEAFVGLEEAREILCGLGIKGSLGTLSICADASIALMSAGREQPWVSLRAFGRMLSTALLPEQEKLPRQVMASSRGRRSSDMSAGSAVDLVEEARKRVMMLVAVVECTFGVGAWAGVICL